MEKYSQNSYHNIHPVYLHTPPLGGGIALAQLCSSTDRPNGEKYQSPWLKGEGWSSLRKTHITASSQYTYTLTLEGGIALAQLHSQLIGQMGKSTKVHGLREKDGVLRS